VIQCTQVKTCMLQCCIIFCTSDKDCKASAEQAVDYEEKIQQFWEALMTRTIILYLIVDLQLCVNCQDNNRKQTHSHAQNTVKCQDTTDGYQKNILRPIIFLGLL